MFAEDSVDDLGNDRVLVADDAGEEWGFGLRGFAEFGDEIFAELVFDATGKAGWGEFAGAEGA